MTTIKNAFEENYSVVISVDGTSNIQSSYNLNNLYVEKELFVGSEISVPRSYNDAKITNIFISEETKTVFLALTYDFQINEDLEKMDFIKKLSNARLLKVVNAKIINQNNGSYEDGDLVEIRDLSEIEEGRIEVWDKDKFLSELMYEDEWKAFEIVE